MARKIFEKENPGVDIEAIRLEEERLAAEKKKISKTKSDEQRQITDSSQKQKIPKQKGIVISEVNYTDINRPRTRSQTQSESDIALTSDNAQVKVSVEEEKVEDTKASWL
ncbi:hypothetical protein RhiirA1_486910, partial [Rhizophagus irregularis]